MSGMDRARFEELKEAYALDALTGEERREFERYLAENPSRQAEVDELSSVATLLALAPTEQEPPPGLRRSLMDRVRSEADAGGPVAGTENRRAGVGRVRRLFGTRGAAVAAAAAAVIGLLVWNVSLQSEVRELRDYRISAYELQGAGEAGSAEGKFMVVGEERAMLVVADLPELPEGRTYEMWTIDEGDPRPSGTFRAGEGPAIETLEWPVSGAETFAITVEPEGGSQRPTSDPIVTADLTRRA